MADLQPTRRGHWPPIRSPLDPFIRKLLRRLSRQDGKSQQAPLTKELEQSELWPPGFVDTIVQSAVAKGYVKAYRRAGQPRTLILTQDGRAWLQYQAKLANPDACLEAGSPSAD